MQPQRTYQIHTWENGSNQTKTLQLNQRVGLIRVRFVTIHRISLDLMDIGGWQLGASTETEGWLFCTGTITHFYLSYISKYSWHSLSSIIDQLTPNYSIFANIHEENMKIESSVLCIKEEVRNVDRSLALLMTALSHVQDKMPTCFLLISPIQKRGYKLSTLLGKKNCKLVDFCYWYCL